MNMPSTWHEQRIHRPGGAPKGQRLAREPGWNAARNALVRPEPLLPVIAMNLRRIASSGHAAWRCHGPARRDEAWKTGEILLLRHQLAVLQRQQTRRPA